MSTKPVDVTTRVFAHERLIVFVLFVLVAFGIRAYADTPRSIFPSISIARIDVVVDAGDLPPDQVDIAIGRPFAAAFQVLPRVTHVVTTASQGSAEFKIDFAEGTDPRTDLQYVDQAIAQIRSHVSQAQAMSSVAVDPSSEPVLSYALTSKTLSTTVLRQFAVTMIAPRMYGIEGLGRFLAVGGSTAEYHVALDPTRLHDIGATAGAAVDGIAAANSVQGVGEKTAFDQRYAVLVDGSLRTIADLKDVAIPTKNGSTIPLADLGSISFGIAPITVATSLNGKHALILNVYAAPGADAIRMAQTVRERLTELQARLPRDVRIENFWDQTTLITASQQALSDAIVLGAVLAIAIIALFLRNVRFTLIAAAIIPIAVAIALVALQLAGQTLNLMSVGGLAVAVGLIIDDAIVVVESIARQRHEAPREPIETAVSSAMGRITQAMIASTLTTVVVFMPLALLSGVSGFFFRALAFTLSAALLVSLALALLLAPILAKRLLAKPRPVEDHHDFISRILARYDPILRWSLNHRIAVGAAALGILAVTVALLASLPSDFLPAMDEGQFEIAYTMPTGTSLAASDSAASMMERVIIRDPAVASVGRFSGVDSNGYSPTQSNQGLLRVRLIDPSRRDGFDDVSDRLRAALTAAVPASLFDIHQILEDMINDLSGTTAPIAIAIHGTDQQKLIDSATELADKLSHVPGLVDASSGVVYDAPSLRLIPNVAALAAQGLTVNDLIDRAGALTQGIVATTLATNTEPIPVRVTMQEPQEFPASLGSLARVNTLRLASDITTDNGQRTMLVTANVQNASLSSVKDKIVDVLAHIALPPGYTTEIGGQIQTQNTSFHEFLLVIAIAVVLVYAVMLAAFRSFVQPCIILAAIPLALIGVALALKITATPVNISSFMGVLLLVGIVVKNGILLIDAANSRRRIGEEMTAALILAGRTRLRPIVMTTLAAIGGLLPLALGIGQGAEMEKPLAIAVIGGLSTATIFTLIVIPVLYAAITPRYSAHPEGLA